jgi:hypothetical protein
MTRPARKSRASADDGISRSSVTSAGGPLRLHRRVRWDHPAAACWERRLRRHRHARYIRGLRAVHRRFHEGRQHAGRPPGDTLNRVFERHTSTWAAYDGSPGDFGTPARPSNGTSSSTRSPRAASRTGRPTMAADSPELAGVASLRVRLPAVYHVSDYCPTRRLAHQPRQMTERACTGRKLGYWR